MHTCRGSGAGSWQPACMQRCCGQVQGTLHPDPHSSVPSQERRLQLIQSYQATTSELEEARRLNEELRLASQVGGPPCYVRNSCLCLNALAGAQPCRRHVVGSEGLVPPPAGPHDLNWLLTTPLAGTFPACFRRSWRQWWAAGRAAWPSFRR